MKFRFSFLSTILLGLILGNASAADQVPPLDLLTQLSSQQQSQLPHQIATAIAGRESTLLQETEDYWLTQRLHQQMAELAQPEVLAPLFVQSLRKIKSPLTRIEKIHELESARTSPRLATTAGEIKGKVTVDGAVAALNVTVLAFDEHGYFSGSAEVQSEDGLFTIDNLPAGSYYVMTMSEEYVDELYDDIPAPLANKAGWRQAKTVSVQSGQTTDNINFDLKSGAVVEGKIFDTDGVTPVEAEDAWLVLADSRTGLPVFEQNVILSYGAYRLIVPMLGSFKLAAMADTYNRTWYPNKTDAAAAAVITIDAYSARLTAIDITMQPAAVTVQTGSLSGSVRGKGQLVGIGIVFVFDAKDTSFVQIGLGLLGSYTIDNLPVGEYFVYGDDYFGNFIEGLGNLVGEFYQDAYTVKKAKTVAVKANQETQDIDFVLEPGGSISGRVLSQGGQALDSLMVLALNPEVLSGSSEPFPSSLKLAAAVTGADGRYKIEGLPIGPYLVRTFSARTLSIVLESPFIKFGEGKHNGKIVDAYYTNIANLLSYKKAAPVSITGTGEVKNIDFTMENAKYINGMTTDAVTLNPLSDVTILALEDSTASLYPVLKTTGEDGMYRLGPLPNGRFKLLALTGFSGSDPHLTEYYDASRDFASSRALLIKDTDLLNINFSLDLGATIQGFVDLAGDAAVHHAGADTLDGFPVLVYNAGTGDLASYDFVQFNGGYRVDRLLPGSYKVLALPATAPFAATYYGGGAVFDDPKSQTVEVQFGQVIEANIKLGQAKGEITGKIFAVDQQKPLSAALAIAYDLTGHPVGIGLTDAELLQADMSSAQGRYQIVGLRQGDYYVRSYNLSANVGMIQGILVLAGGLIGGGAALDPLALLTGDLLGNLNLDLSVYQDQWYKDLAIKEQLNLQELVFKFAAYGLTGENDNAIFPIYLPLPFYQSIPKSATSIRLAEGAIQNEVNFNLLRTNFSDWMTQVEEPSKQPRGFSVAQNYPNPFNPTTTLSFSVARPSHISITIFDVLGHQLAVLADRRFEPGEYAFAWNGRDSAGRPAASGLFLAVVKSDVETKTIKMVMMK